MSLLIGLLEEKFGGIPEEKRDLIYVAPREKLLCWIYRILRANTLADVLSDSVWPMLNPI